MGRYYSYGQNLNDAFIAARDAYAEAYAKLTAAQDEAKAANEWHKEKYIGENERRKLVAQADLIKAQDAFKQAEATIWPGFNQRRDELRRSLEETIRAKGMASPDDIDNNALELLKSGIMSAEEMANMAAQYDSNPTMLRLVGKYAKEAEKAANSHAEKLGFRTVAMNTESGQSSIMKVWDALSEVADRCSGQAEGRSKGEPEYIVSMGRHWERLSEALISEM